MTLVNGLEAAWPKPGSAVNGHPSTNGSPPGVPAVPDAADLERFIPRYTFDQFIIGDGNRLAHAAALAVADLNGDGTQDLVALNVGGNSISIRPLQVTQAAVATLSPVAVPGPITEVEPTMPANPTPTSKSHYE